MFVTIARGPANNRTLPPHSGFAIREDAPLGTSVYEGIVIFSLIVLLSMKCKQKNVLKVHADISFDGSGCNEENISKVDKVIRGVKTAWTGSVTIHRQTMNDMNKNEPKFGFRFTYGASCVSNTYSWKNEKKDPVILRNGYKVTDHYIHGCMKMLLSSLREMRMREERGRGGKKLSKKKIGKTNWWKAIRTLAYVFDVGVVGLLTARISGLTALSNIVDRLTFAVCSLIPKGSLTVQSLQV